MKVPELTTTATELTRLQEGMKWILEQKSQRPVLRPAANQLRPVNNQSKRHK